MGQAGGAPRAKDVLKTLEGPARFDAVVELAGRRGFFHPSAEIYGGLAGFYDYGPLGAAMMRRMQGLWVDYWTRKEGFFLVDTPTISPEAVFRASGHLEKFADPMVECRKCGTVSRADQAIVPLPTPGVTPEQSRAGVDTLVKIACPNCGSADLIGPRQSNLMIETRIGAVKPTIAYLRPETAQGIFWNFPALLRHNRGRVPFGVAQLGLGYRNEIAPRNALFRLREFHMAEVEVFIDPSKKSWPRFSQVAHIEAAFHARDGAIHFGTFGEMVKSGIIRNEVTGHFAACAYDIVQSFGMPDEKMRLRQHMPEEMAHYAEDCWDLELETSLGWIECAGIADRGVYDLTRHQEYSGADMAVFMAFDEPKMVEVDGFVPDFRALGPKFRGDAAAVGEAVRAAPISALRPDGSLHVTASGKEYVVDGALFKRAKRNEKKTGESFVPNVVEPSFGLDRIFFALMDAALTRVEKEGEPYTILRLDPRVAPVTVCVFPLMAKENLRTVAEGVHRDLLSAGISSSFDDAGSIGKRYARADEAGVPWCITVDYESLADKAATLRHRDTQSQERLPLGGIVPRVRSLLASEGGTN